MEQAPVDLRTVEVGLPTAPCSTARPDTDVCVPAACGTRF